MTLLLVDVSDHKAYYYTSCIGAFITIIIISFIFINIFHHYIQIFHSKNENEPQNKTTYILFFILCIISLLVSIQYAFIKNNLITHQSPSSFTIHQCSITLYFSFGAIIIVQCFTFVLLIYRIRVTFKDSIYAYSKTVYLSLIIGLIIVTMFSLSTLIYSHPDTYYVLEYYNTVNTVYCAAIAEENSDKAIANLLGVIVFVVAQVVYDLVLLYMFTQRLYALQSELISQHLDDGNHSKTADKISVESTSPTCDGMSVELGDMMDNESKVKKTLTVADITKDKDDHSAKRILSLHKLIKQHTILIFIMVLYSVIWIFLLIFVSSKFIQQVVYVGMVNVVCFWLMFASSYKYWKFLIRYCCCSVCYCNKKRDVNARTCLFFC
eukprot:468765_1